MTQSKQEKIKQIQKTLDKIRPSLQADGGDIEIVSWDDDSKVLKVKFLGMCSHCPMAQITLNETVAKQVIKENPEVKDIISV